jgi:predicted GH43/DUF377 family glycosyl hydrolase
MPDLLPLLRTPHKVGRLVLTPSYKRGAFDSHAVDCPFLYQHEGRYYMTYIGWDGRGYQTGLASSDDLLLWRKEGLVFARGPAGSLTEHNAGLNCILRDNDLFGSATLKRAGGRYVGGYHTYPLPGYEEGPGVIGIAYSADLRRWEPGPIVLRPEEGAEWEAGGLYKPWLLEHEGRYYLFYNAKNRTTGPWREQTGLAISDDLLHWERYAGNPVLRNGPAGAFDDIFASDPVVLRHGDTWAMFYFGLCSDGHARDGVAFSRDLLHWEKAGEILIDAGPEGSIDSLYAHKPGIISRDGKLYHFYCAVSRAADPHQGEIEHGEVRGISAAVS